MKMLHSMDSVLPSEIRLTRSHVGHTAVTHGMILSSINSMVVRNTFPATSTDEYVILPSRENPAQWRQRRGGAEDCMFFAK
jgi:hypothetical protein